MSRLWIRVCAALLLVAAVAVPARAASESSGNHPSLTIPTPEERDRLLRGGKKQVTPEAPSMQDRATLDAQDEFDVTRYFLDLDFDEVARRVSGTVTITVKSVVPSLEHVVLDLNNAMAVSSVTRGGIPQSFIRPGHTIDITLDLPLEMGEMYDIVVTYGGLPLTGEYFGWNKYSGGAQGEMVWSLSEPYGAREWWPCKDRPDDKAIVEEWYTVNTAWIATGNGLLQGVENVNGKRRYRFLATNPLTTYLVSVSATNFSTFSHTYTPLGGGSMPVKYYVYPEDLSDAQVSFSETPAMIQFFATTFGEYPFVADQYGMTSFPAGGAMEHSTNTSYTYNLITGTHTYDWIIAHELSHQWWGDSVSPETWRDIWLNEGFASYCEALWSEHLGGGTAYRNYMQSMWRNFSGTVYNPSNLFGTTVYDKGAWVQHMLRRVLGDSNFFLLLQTWYNTHKDGVGNTALYQSSAELIYGSSLNWFFAQWVYGPNQPTYQFGWTTTNLGNGTYRTYVRIRQTQTSPSVFTMPVDLSLTVSGAPVLRSVWNSARDEDFILDTNGPVSAIAFDPSNWILKTNATTFTLPDVDADGVPDRNDNCSSTANPTQSNADGDLQGDACDSDDDNDLLPDASDCAPLDSAQGAPSEVASLSIVTNGAGEADLSWTAAARADTYDISRGMIGDLASGYGSCFASGVNGLTATDTEIPPADGGFQYLVRAVDSGCGGPGSAGVSSSGARVLPCP